MGIPENFDYAGISLQTFPFFGRGVGGAGGGGVGVDIRKRQKPQKIEQSKTVTDIRKP